MEADDRGTLETDEFAEAFEKASGAPDQPDLKPEDNPENITEEVAKVEPEVAPVVETVVPEAVDPSLQQPGESDEKYEQRYKTLKGIFDHEKTEWKTEKETLLKQIEEAKKPAEKPKEVTTVDEPPLLSEEDQEALKQYEEDFDVISKMEGKKREVALAKIRKEISDHINGLKDELKAEFATQLAPAVELVKETQKEREERSTAEHFATIRESHPDYEKYVEDESIKTWIATKPKYLQKGMMETYSAGDAESIVELLNDFKAENGISSPSTAEVIPINTKKQEKMLAMTAVTTRRGAVNVKMAPANDFESAFDEAVNKQGG
jgi:hypothetical protein